MKLFLVNCHYWLEVLVLVSMVTVVVSFPSVGQMALWLIPDCFVLLAVLACPRRFGTKSRAGRSLAAALHSSEKLYWYALIWKWILKLCIVYGFTYYHSLRHVGIQTKHLPWHKHIKKQPTIISRTLAPQLMAFTSLTLPLTGSNINVSTISA